MTRGAAPAQCGQCGQCVRCHSLEGGDNTIRSPAEAGPSAGTQLKSGVNKHIYGPADLDKEKEKAETEEALWEAGQGWLSWEALGCSS